MRRLVWTVVVLAILAGGAVVTDSVLRGEAEDRIASEVTAIPGMQTTPGVSIGGFPFLTQVAGGSLDTVRLTTPTATVDGLLLDDVEVELSGVLIESPYTASRAVLTARTTPEAVEDVLAVDLDLAVRGGQLVARTTVAGLPLDVVLAPRVSGREVSVEITGFVLAGVTVSADDVPAEVTAGLTGLRFVLDGLPAGMDLTEVSVLDDGLLLRAEGADLDLAAAVAAG
jgi:hypothetical protein